ncbi:hypothetical protein CWB73_20070 [Pseudoalteromonas phenolica]|uniref:Uncharacterized protein n=1 Tax=Pseudoalteromonas phenolica TaxID=161398 RepID=A0A5S3YPF1_9GAMM|nr:hypothetical protein [Pseudoalteromonas phenolica]TMP77434.1 hypothetical protein CWB73_20070 [Pseudoalteromonas phenolica]
MNKIAIPIALMAVSSIIIFTHNSQPEEASLKSSALTSLHTKNAPPISLPTQEAQSKQSITAMAHKTPDVKAPAMQAAPVSPSISAPPLQPNHQTRSRHGHNEKLEHGHEHHQRPKTHNDKIPPTGANF